MIVAEIFDVSIAGFILEFLLGLKCCSRQRFLVTSFTSSVPRAREKGALILRSLGLTCGWLRVEKIKSLWANWRKQRRNGLLLSQAPEDSSWVKLPKGPYQLLRNVFVDFTNTKTYAIEIEWSNYVFNLVQSWYLKFNHSVFLDIFIFIRFSCSFYFLLLDL